MLTGTCAHTFTSNRQLPFSNQRKVENDPRSYFMKSYVAELGFKLATPRSAVRPSTECANDGARPLRQKELIKLLDWNVFACWVILHAFFVICGFLFFFFVN